MKLPTLSKREIARQLWPGLSPEAGFNRLARWEKGEYDLEFVEFLNYRAIVIKHAGSLFDYANNLEHKPIREEDNG